MNNLITAQDAYNAMMAGKNVLCRAAGEILNFNDIDQFPATIFAKTGYEFCIKLDMIEVAGITFTKPLLLSEYQQGQDVYIVNTYGSSIYIADFTCNALIESINSGFVQRDAENAKLHLQAISKLMGCELPLDISVVRLGSEKPKTKPKTKAKAPTAAVENVQISASNDVVENTSQSNIQITEVCETVIQEDNLVTFDDTKNQLNHEKSLRDRIAVALTISDLEALLPELQQLHGESGHLIISQYEQRECELKRIELLTQLLERAAAAQTPVEANALVTYTRSWTEEQRKPPLDAINKRLIELAPAEPEKAPLLMTQILRAPDLTTLDILEIDVGARSPEMQPKFMAEILKRRRVLESQGVA